MTDYKNKYIKYKLKYLNLVGGVPIPMQEIDLKSCTKLSYFQKDPKTVTKTNLEKYDFNKCYIKIKDSEIKDICTILFQLVSHLHDLVEFIKIFKDNPNLAALVKKILEMFELFNFKFDLLNLLSFLYNFINFLTDFIKKINNLFIEVYKHITNFLVRDFKDFNYFLLHFTDYDTFVANINITFFIKVFRNCYDTIFRLIRELSIKVEQYKTILFNNFNERFKNNMQTLYELHKITLKKTFVMYEHNLRIGLVNICKKIISLTENTCQNFLYILKSILNSQKKINEEIVELFLQLMKEFECINKNKAAIFNNLKEMGVILNFLSTPQKQKEIDTSLVKAEQLLTRVQKVLLYFSKNKTNYTQVLLEKLDLLESNLKSCLNTEHKIFKSFQEFRASLHPTSISNENIQTLNAILHELNEFIKSKEKCNDQSKINKKELEKIAINILKILEENRIDKPEKSLLARVFGRKKKYKIENLTGGLNGTNIIDLKSCSKFTFFKKRELKEDFKFDPATFDRKKTLLNQHKIDSCFKKIDGLIRNIDFEKICMTLLNLVSELDDFVQFIQIFLPSPFNEEKVIHQIFELFNSFNFELFVLDLNKLPIFLHNFYIFLRGFIEKINILFNNVLLKNKSIYEINFMNFIYFSLSLDDYSVFHNQTFVRCPIIFKVFRERYDIIMKLINELSEGLTVSISFTLQHQFELLDEINNLYKSFDKLKKTITTQEIDSRKRIGIYIEKIRSRYELRISTESVCVFSLDDFSKKIISNLYNEEIIEEFLKLIKQLNCIKEGKIDVFNNLKQIGAILKPLSSPQKQKEIDASLEEVEKSFSKIQQVLFVKDVKVVKDILLVKLDELEGNLLLCFNGQGFIFTAFKNLKKKLDETPIRSQEDIDELNKINIHLTAFIKSKKEEDKCKSKNKDKIDKKADLQVQLLSIRKILQQKILQQEILQQQRLQQQRLQPKIS